MLFDIKLSDEEKDYLKKECINLYDYVSSDIRENYGKYSYFYTVNFVLHTLNLNFLNPITTCHNEEIDSHYHFFVYQHRRFFGFI